MTFDSKEEQTKWYNACLMAGMTREQLLDWLRAIQMTNQELGL